RGFFRDGSAHGDRAERGAGFESRRLSGTHSDGERKHVLARDAELGNEFPNLAVELGGQRDVGGGQGSARFQAEDGAGFGEQLLPDVRMQHVKASGPGVAKDEGSSKVPSAVIAD